MTKYKYSHLKKGSKAAKEWGKEMARLRKLKAKQRKDRSKIKSLEDSHKSNISKKRYGGKVRKTARTRVRYVKRGFHLTKKHYEETAIGILGLILGIEIAKRM